jgi:UDP-glucuronate decarboxylase
MKVSYTEPVNLGNPNEFTMLELAKAIETLVGKTIEIEFKPLPSDDPKQRKPDITVAKRELGWEPMIQLAEGLKLTHAHFNQSAGVSGGKKLNLLQPS